MQKLLLILSIFILELIYAKDPFPTQCKSNTIVKIEESQLVFKELLAFYKQFPKKMELQKELIAKFKAPNQQFFENGNEAALKARMKRYNLKYCKALIKFFSVINNKRALNIKFAKTPLSKSKKRLSIKNESNQLSEALIVISDLLFQESILANQSFMQFVNLLPSNKRIVKEKITIPKLPGRYGGSRADRIGMKEEDKVFLTPVDPEFDFTQIGAKFMQDTGAPAEFWSYDFDKGEVYLAGKSGETYKMRVRVDGGETFVETRSGKQYFEPVGSALKVNFGKTSDPSLKGSFLSKRESSSLFGDFPSSEPKTVWEDNSGKSHFDGDGHDHSKEKTF